MKTPRKIPYGLANYERVITQNYLYVDKSMYLEELEKLNECFLFFLRPRRFGKSLFISMLQYYYGIEHKEKFTSLFGQTYIGAHPTLNANTYYVIKFDFSKINTDTEENTFEGFNSKINRGIQDFNSHYKCFTKKEYQTIIGETQASEKMEAFFGMLVEKNTKQKVYVLIDEYDHFANEILAFNFTHFSEIISRNGYVRKFYEAIKAAAGEGIVERMFATGVTPVTLDSLTSGFNIGSNISFEPDFNEMMGFTEAELRYAIRETCEEGRYNEDQLVSEMEAWYNGSLFHPKGASRLYNSDMVLYFLSKYTQSGYQYPEQLVDLNIASDYGKIKRFLNLKNPERNAALLTEIITNEYIDSGITKQFSFERDFTPEDFISILFYNGLLTIKEAQMNQIRFMMPNYVIKELYWGFFAEYLRGIANITVETIDIAGAVRALAQENNMVRITALMETITKQLSNRDLIQFDEKNLKLVFLVFLSTGAMYTMKSEPEYGKTYPDLLLLFKKPLRPNYQILIEFKYLKKSNKKQLAAKKQEAIEQVRGYLAKEEIQELEDLKSWIIIFVGDKAAVVEEVKG